MSTQIDEIIKSLHEAFLAMAPGLKECVDDAARKVEDASCKRRIKGADGQPLERLGPKVRRGKNSEGRGSSPGSKPRRLPRSKADAH